MNTSHLLSALALSLAALSAHAQTYQVASSAGGQQIAAAPINQADIYNRINAAQGTANNAQGTANDAQWRAQIAQGTADNASNTANWASQVAQNAQSRAEYGVGLGQYSWEYAHAVHVNLCMATSGFPQYYCEALANSTFPRR